jgi:hypothetical protein
MSAGKRAKVYGESWFAKTVVRRLFLLFQFATEGSMYTSDQEYANDRYGFDKCKEVVYAVAMEVRSVAYLEGILPHSRNLTAMGKVVDAVLSRTSHNYRISPQMNPTGHPRSGGLFVEGPEHVSSRFWYSLSSLHRVTG